ncbi:MAG: VWA domain-containing protein [bacterium]|nr:VWA domain-containing protein [bacterium]
MKYLALKSILTGALVLFPSYSIAAQQDSDPNKDSEKTIKVETTLINVPLIISDSAGLRVSGIRKEDISVFAGGGKLDIDFFADSEEPVKYAILIDSSGSTSKIRLRMGNAARKFVDTFSEADQGMVVRFDDRVRLIEGLTSNRKKVKYAIGSHDSYSGGRGLMNESIVFVLREHFKDAKGRKAIILLTDAGEINQKSSQELLKELSVSDVMIYPIIYQSHSIDSLVFLSGDTKGAEELKKMKSVSVADLVKYPPFDHLDRIARTSGGRLLFPDEKGFEAAFLNIADELRKQYLIGFYVDAGGNASDRQITIKVNRPDVVVRTKQSIRVAAP